MEEIGGGREEGGSEKNLVSFYRRISRNVSYFIFIHSLFSFVFSNPLYLDSYVYLLRAEFLFIMLTIMSSLMLLAQVSTYVYPYLLKSMIY